MTYGVALGSSPDAERWRRQRRLVRRGPGTPFRKAQTLTLLATRDRAAVLRAFVAITNHVRGYHTLTEILTVSDRILRLAGRPGLTVVEAGAGAGASTAKLSLVTKAAGGRLHVFDTFRGMPGNDEEHHLLDGTPLRFRAGAFRGRLGAVRRRVERFGAIDVCELHKGLLEDTLPRWRGHVDVALVDVDLAASTAACVRELHPRLRPGGCLLSQDGHLRATHALLSDGRFWRREVGCEPPRIAGLGRDKLLEIPAQRTTVAQPSST